MSKILKIIKCNILIIFILYSLSPLILADDENEQLEDRSSVKKNILETSSKIENIPNINSKSAIVLDRNSKTILYGKNENEKRKMASTTKIMTCLLAIENCNLKDTVKISKKSAGTRGSRLGLKTNDKITVENLLYGLMLCSGNDAAVAIAEHVSGSVDGFAVLMNNKAKELGLKNTSFETPHGLDAPNHYTTAFELSLLANEALKNKTFLKIVGTKNYTISINGYPKTLSNTNELLGNLNGVYGVKTGFTNGANRCLVTACKRNNLDVICVVLGADTKKFRTQDSIKLIEYTYKNYQLVDLQKILDEKFEKWKQENINSFVIEKGVHNKISLKIDDLENNIIPINNNFINNINIDFLCNKKICAPVNKGLKIGEVCINIGNDSIITKNICVDCDIEKKGVDFYLNYLLCSFSKLRLNDFL